MHYLQPREAQQLTSLCNVRLNIILCVICVIIALLIIWFFCCSITITAYYAATKHELANHAIRTPMQIRCRPRWVGGVSQQTTDRASAVRATAVSASTAPAS